jgi:hypothetical protein
MFKQLEKNILVLSSYICACCTFILIFHINWCERDFFDNSDDRHLGIIAAFILFLTVFLLVIFHLILFTYNLIGLLKSRSKEQYKKLFTFIVGVMLAIIWAITFSYVSNNGTCDWFWGPGDSGLVYIGLTALTVNYYYLKIRG